MNQILNQKSIVHMQDTEVNNWLSCCILDHIHKIDTHRERVTDFREYFTELKERYMKFPLERKVLQEFEKLKNINLNFLNQPHLIFLLNKLL